MTGRWRCWSGRGSCPPPTRRSRSRRRSSLARAHCRGAYLRGAFLAAGTVAPPRRPAHLEIRTHDAAAAAFLARVAARDGIALRVRERPSHAAVYTKRLGDARGPARAHRRQRRRCCGWWRARSCRPPRQDANRQANAETANLRRQVVAARRQLSAIGLLDVGCAAAASWPRRRRCGSSTRSCRWRSWPCSATSRRPRWPVACGGSRRSPTTRETRVTVALSRRGSAPVCSPAGRALATACGSRPRSP